ncbi:hypothetical protein PSHT_12176, partial [Puccinia striiformis]
YTLMTRMPIYSGFQRIGLQILCFLQIAQCMAPRVALPAMDIRDSIQGEAIGIENSGSREQVRKYLESVPHFAQQVTIFPELVQKDSLKNEFIHLTEYLENFEKGKEFLSLRKNDQKLAQDILEQRNHLKAFHQLVLARVQQKIIDSNPKAKSSHYVNVKKDAISKNKIARKKWWIPLNKISDWLMPQKNNYKRENHTDVMVIILEKAMIESLSKILLDIYSLKSNKPSTWHPTFLKLQNHVFQILAYMYKHSLITEESFRKFCNTYRLSEIAANSMVQTFRLQYKPYQVGWSKILPNYSNFSQYRIFLLGLEPYEKRFFSYRSLGQFLNDNYSTMMTRLDRSSIWIHFDSNFFGRLEKYVRAVSNQALETFKTGDTDYDRIKRDLMILVKINHEQLAKECRPVSFFILQFVQDNYGKEILQINPTDELFEKRIDFMSAHYQKSTELQNIIHYLEGGVESDIPGHKCITDIESGKKNIKDLQEEYSLLEQYVDLVDQKDQKLFTENNWKHWSVSHNELVTEIKDHISSANEKALAKTVLSQFSSHFGIG